MKAPVETVDAITVGILSERIRQMPVDSRALFLVAELSAIDGPAALAVLCDARNALTARIREELDLRGLTDVPSEPVISIPKVAQELEALAEASPKARGPFFEISPDSLARLHQSRVDRAKQLLELVSDLVGTRLGGDGLRFGDHEAERLAVLLFGNK